MKEKIFQNWMSLSDYDIVTAKVMLDTKRYLYVAFMCQQAVEKMLKACFVKEHQTPPPYTHSLVRIAEKLSLFNNIDQDRQQNLELLNSYYITSRYSEDFDEFSKAITPENAKRLFDFTEGFLQWLKSQIQ
jgi:HEPN domain-containing protein